MTLRQYAAPPLSFEEEQTLARTWKATRDTKARDTLILSNLRFAIKVIGKSRRSAERDDLEQEVTVGMLEALERFDPDRGYRFISYAVDFIKEGIERAELGSCLVKPPTSTNMRKIKEESVEAAQLARLPMRSLDYPVRTGHADRGDAGFETGRSLTLSDKLADPNATAEPDESGRLSDEFLNRCTPLERLVLVRRFFDEKLFPEIGEEIGVSNCRVQQIEAATIERLRNNVDADSVPRFDNGWWKTEANAFVLAFGGRVVEMGALTTWAGRRYAIYARKYLRNLLAYLSLAGRAEWYGDVVKVEMRRSLPKLRA